MLLFSTELQICNTEGFFKTSAKLASLSWRYWTVVHFSPRSEVWTAQRPDPGAQGHVAEPDWLSGRLNISSSCWQSSCFSRRPPLSSVNTSIHMCHNLGSFPNQRRSWKDKFRPLMFDVSLKNVLWWVKEAILYFLGFLYLSFVVLWSIFMQVKVLQSEKVPRRR